MKIINAYKAQEVREGAGVIVNRVFGYHETKVFDPFLMLDYFENENVKNSPGFPWHPHKGIETISYILKGSIQHEDSIGNKGSITSGELQWMSAGKGIMHQEMPLSSDEGLQGFQFWLNLPREKKLKQPEYAYIGKGEMKMVKDEHHEVRVIAGSYKDTNGPIDKSDLGVTMLHVKVSPGQSISFTRTEAKSGFIFVFKGSGQIEDETIEKRYAYTLDVGQIDIEAHEELEFIFAEGKPLKEPIAWSGPIVMNTKEELRETFRDIDNGTFARKE